MYSRVHHVPLLMSVCCVCVVPVHVGGRAFISTDGPFLSGRGKVFPNGTLLITDLRLDESQDLTCSIVGPGGVHEETIPLVVFSE